MRHRVERARERHELGGPALSRGADLQIAVADMHRHAGERTQRPHDRVLAADPDAEQHERADQGELEVGRAHLGIDAAQHLGLVEADRHECAGVRQPREAEHAPHAVDALDRRDAAVARLQVAQQRVGLETLAQPGVASGMRRQHGAVEVGDQHQRARPARRFGADAVDPLQLEARHDDAAGPAVLLERRHCGDEADTARASDRQIAHHEGLATLRFLEVGPVRKVEPDAVGDRRAGDPSVRADNRQPGDPGRVRRRAGEEAAAVLL